MLGNASPKGQIRRVNVGVHAMAGSPQCMPEITTSRGSRVFAALRLPTANFFHAHTFMTKTALWLRKSAISGYPFWSAFWYALKPHRSFSSMSAPRETARRWVVGWVGRVFGARGRREKGGGRRGGTMRIRTRKMLVPADPLSPRAHRRQTKNDAREDRPGLELYLRPSRGGFRFSFSSYPYIHAAQHRAGHNNPG